METDKCKKNDLLKLETYFMHDYAQHIWPSETTHMQFSYFQMQIMKIGIFLYTISMRLASSKYMRNTGFNGVPKLLQYSSHHFPWSPYKNNILGL